MNTRVTEFYPESSDLTIISQSRHHKVVMV